MAVLNRVNSVVGTQQNEWCIVAEHSAFVNRNASPFRCSRWSRRGILTGVLAVSLASNLLTSFALAQPPQPSVLYSQAKEKLGEPSRIRWTEPVSPSLQRWDAPQVVEFDGVISDWTREKLTLVKPQGTGITTYPGDLVIGIDPGWKLQEFAAVHELFCQRRFNEVIKQGQTALLLSGAPRWQQRLLVTEMVQSACAIGQWGVAGRIFGFLVKDDPPDLLLASMPLPWSDEVLTAGASVTIDAAKWLDDESPAMQLLGASWSISGELRPRAIQTLQSLSQSESVLLAGFAKAQLWRTIPPGDALSSQQPQWYALRDALPLPGQAGPTMLLGYRLEQSNQHDLAIAEWLRIASLHADRYHLHRGAIEKAIANCKSTGRDDLGRRLAESFPMPSAAPPKSQSPPRTSTDSSSPRKTP
jgi:hypothetical protein